MAYDHIMVFHDRFKNHILPEKIHILNVSFHVPELHIEFGGCAGNIAYNLGLLGAEGHPMATVGADFGMYDGWMDECRMSRQYVRAIPGTLTAQAFITTDMDDNQITAFHPGAMNHSHENAVPTGAGITLGMVSPDGRDGMIQHAEQFAGAGIPFIFDPGQGLPLFNADDLRRFIGLADWVTVNDYEWQLMQNLCGFTEAEVAAQVRALVVTLGAKGSRIYADGAVHEIPVAPVRAAADPTGCGDAYRAGLIYGLMNQLDWPVTGRIASLMGGIKIESKGTQNHRFTRADLDARYQEAFGMAL
jgi:adenosine kinase